MPTIRFPRSFLVASLAVCMTIGSVGVGVACTYIQLKAEDDSYIVGRTMEWGTFDLEPALAIVPRGSKLSAMKMPDGKDGATWSARYGFTGISLLGRPAYADAINEKGLAGHLLYLPGFAEYQAYEPAEASKSIAPTDFLGYFISQFATVEEVKEALDRVRVVPVVEPALGFPAPVHYVINDPSGAEIVIEYVGGKLTTHTKTVGVMTNSPPYDWHLNNLRNYLNLRAVAWPEVDVDGIDLTPIGAGSGMLGLPGDFTPPSRFVRAVALAQTAPATKGGYDTVREFFNIMDSFNVPLPVVGEKDNPKGFKPLCCSTSTQYTVAFDPANKMMYYHTDDNRTVRSVNLGDIDYDSLNKTVTQELRTQTEAIVDDVTPKL
ncbi:MAG: linear amide C-N hydrolase [Pseudomonadota bacterium]